jgi:hypothetical protein
MKTLNHNSVECFSMEEGTSDAPLPPRKQSNVRQLAPGYLWNGATQELIPILPVPVEEPYSGHRAIQPETPKPRRPWPRTNQ